ncbi:DNA topoisomerase, type IA, zn finger domain protein [Psychromonas ingrahamii 37]|uniref:DNA topoisomerase, type IA, zn finger domain protein n=1 Tax=Psychromonas ingrahamii (strain DSM 17664 / CCUG 51855 / 37) TaxID=357804 RepID=A1SR33_PSYIN|nr:topoisomerase DNA-binding C4 zinc finger domain-containing protein [Psychromonas ingrahamii]ABM01948.1 DNA topoisomerase, type IA, zn finger domain protein [Psychromonas ingrahamii 37]
MPNSQEGLHSHHKKTKELCPECASELHIRNSKQGIFLGCSNYPECKYLRPLHEKSEIEKVLPGTRCALCGKEQVLKQGKYGLFIGCSAYPECSHTEQLSEKKEIADEKESVPCPSCKNGHLIKRHSRFGKIFYACDNYPSCKYAVNDKPVNQFCPDCHWPILVERKTASTFRIICPKKGCGYRGKPI